MTEIAAKDAPTFGRSRTPQSKPSRRILTQSDFPAKGINYHPNHLRRMWMAGTFPKPFHLSPRRIAWDEADIDAWIEAKLAQRPDTSNGESEMIPALTAAGYRPVSKDALIRRGWFNEVSFNALKHVAITLYPSSGGDYALNEKALRDNLQAISEGQLEGGKIFLADRLRGKVIFSITLSDMAARLEGKSTRDGDRGPYFWINARGHTPDDTEELADAPFPVSPETPW